jgi:hypothetical protein
MVWGSNTSISHCHILNTIGNTGLEIGYSCNNTLRNNTLKNCTLWVHCNSPSQVYHDIDTSNTINGKPIYYLIDENNYRIDETYEIGYLGLVSCTNVTVENINSQGIFIGSSSNIQIQNCTVHHAESISVFSSQQINISYCSITSSSTGISVTFFSSYISISNCTIIGGEDGISVDLYCENVSISRCIIASCQIAGVSVGGKNNTVENVSVSQSKNFGIWIGGSNIQVSTCYLLNNSIGLFVWGNNNVLNNNDIVHNTYGIFCLSGSDNYIHHNNFIYNQYNANASEPNNWYRNYWDDWIGLKSNILHFFPYHITVSYSQNFVRTFLSNFDWHPSSEPYDIP